MSVPSDPDDPDDPPAGPPVFLLRRTYRRRRLGDAARILPVVAAILFLLPAFGLAPERGGARLVFLFAAWIGLALVAAVLSRALIRAEAERPGEEAPQADRAR